jgi:hypothetical protein
MTFYEANPDAKRVGAEVDEFVDAPAIIEERPWPGSDPAVNPDVEHARPQHPTIVDEQVVGDEHTFAVQFTDSNGVSEICSLVVTATAASVWRTSEREAAGALAGAIDVAVPRALPAVFRFASETIPPSLPLAAVCQEITTGRWKGFTTEP